MTSEKVSLFIIVFLQYCCAMLCLYITCLHGYCVLWTWCLSAEPTKSHHAKATVHSIHIYSWLHFYTLPMVICSEILRIWTQIFFTRNCILIICINKGIFVTETLNIDHAKRMYFHCWNVCSKCHSKVEQSRFKERTDP